LETETLLKGAFDDYESDEKARMGNWYGDALYDVWHSANIFELESLLGGVALDD
jgi:hypothetical protein